MQWKRFWGKKVYSERERERRWWAQGHQIGAKKLLGWWPFMRPSEVSVSTQTGLTLSSGPFVLARMSSFSFSLFLSLEDRIFYSFYTCCVELWMSWFELFINWVVFIYLFIYFSAEELEVVMAARLEMITAACKYGFSFPLFGCEDNTIRLWNVKLMLAIFSHHPKCFFFDSHYLSSVRGLQRFLDYRFVVHCSLGACQLSKGVCSYILLLRYSLQIVLKSF